MNNRYRNAPSLRGPTKASATTLCQKCLKRDTYSPDYQYLSAITDSALRHYSYECNVSAQERPYLARPSRTQQLQNPNLRPKLSSDTPNDLLRTYVSSNFSFLFFPFFFLAPECLADPLHRKGLADELLAKREEDRGRKRDQDGFDSLGGQGLQPKRARSESSHSMSSVSTVSTNRSPSQSPSRHDSGQRKRRYTASSSDRSVSSYSSGKDTRSRSREWTRERNTRRRRREASPGERGRRRDLSRDGSRRYRSRSRSRDRDEIAKGRRSMTPNSTREQKQYRRRSRENRTSLEPSLTSHSRQPRYNPDNSAPQPPRERSLSPFSKRLALTQAMNMGN